MTTFICVFEPTTEARTNGAVPLTIAFNAANIKIAAATAMIKLSEAYPESMDNFDIDEPIICEDTVGSPRPALDQFDEKFAIENEFDGEKWQPIKYKEFKKLATTRHTETMRGAVIHVMDLIVDGEKLKSKLPLITPNSLLISLFMI